MGRIDRDRALARMTDNARWSDPSSLEPAWDARAQLAAQFIPAGARVLDLGCGKMSLQHFLPHGCSYRGCDLVARDAQTIVCDFNMGQFPTEAATYADIIVMLGGCRQECGWNCRRAGSENLKITFQATRSIG